MKHANGTLVGAVSRYFDQHWVITYDAAADVMVCTPDVLSPVQLTIRCHHTLQFEHCIVEQRVVEHGAVQRRVVEQLVFQHRVVEHRVEHCVVERRVVEHRVFQHRVIKQRAVEQRAVQQCVLEHRSVAARALLRVHVVQSEPWSAGTMHPSQ